MKAKELVDAVRENNGRRVNVPLSVRDKAIANAINYLQRDKRAAGSSAPACACSARAAFIAWRGPRPTSDLVDKREWDYDSEMLWEAWRRGMEYAQNAKHDDSAR